MSATQIPALDHTVQQTNLWLKKLVDEHHFKDRHQAHNALRAVIQILRDQLSVEQAVHLAAQLPMLVRGIFFEGYLLGPDGKLHTLRSSKAGSRISVLRIFRGVPTPRP